MAKYNDLEVENVFVDPVTGEPIDVKGGNCEFEIGDFIVSNDKTTIGVFSGECVTEDMSEKWPSFFFAFAEGKYIENYDDMDCCEDDEVWTENYHLATDEEKEELLIALEATTGLTWDENELTLAPLNGVKGDDWKQEKQYYPSTWAAGIDSDVDEMCNFEDNCYFSKEFRPLCALSQLIILCGIYMKGLTLTKGETVYAIVFDSVANAPVIRPYIYGVRNSILTFKSDTQVREFLTNFESLVLEASTLLQ